MNKIFTDEVWTKNWSGNWGLLFGSLYGQMYTKGVQELTGASFHHTLIIFTPTASVNYLIVRELKEFCSHLVALIERDQSLPKQLCDQVIQNTDAIFPLMKSLDAKKQFSKLDFDMLQTTRFAITTANFSLKKVIDYLPKEVMEKYLDLFTRVRLYTEPVYNEADRLLKKICLSFLGNKIPPTFASVLTTEEMEIFFEKGIAPSNQDLEQRLGGCAILYDQSGVGKIFTATEFDSLMTAISKTFENGEIKGMVAYPGKVIGRVRIVLDPQHCSDFAEGDILVAGMTRPEYLSLMKKSAAFITDAGGLLSHAAIVAREMKKPCIVGTEVATKVLKDDDMVEVNAMKGIVRKM